MSFAQERLWLIDLAMPGSPTYNVPLLTRWYESIDPAALAVALEQVVTRHEVLRTTYALRDDQPVQVVGAPVPVDVEVIEGSTRVDAEVAARARRPFYLATGPLVRCTVWRGAPGGDLMLLVVHHIAIDGWSLAIFYGDLAAAYDAALAGIRPELPDLPIQYADFALWDRETNASPRRRQQLATRATELIEISALILAGARPGGVAREGGRSGHWQSFRLSERLWSGVRLLARSQRTTPFVVLHAAFQAVLAQWSGREDFVVGVVTGNRPHPAVEPLVGFFVNTVPMRCRVRPEWTFEELCTEVRAEAYRLLTHQWLPFDRLTSGVAAVRAGGHQSLVNVCFALQNMPAPSTSSRWTPPAVLPTGTAKFDLLLVVEETTDGVVGSVEYDPDRYPDDVCEGVIANLLDVLDAAVTDHRVPLRRLRVAAPEHPGHVDAEPTEPTEPPADLTTYERRAVELFGGALSTIDRAGRTAIGTTSNFFALGGHSLLAVTMLAQAGRRYGVALSPRHFLADPTVAVLARLLAAGSGNLEPDGHAAGPHPATSAQQRFWFLDRVEALRAAYLMPAVLDLRGEVDRTALRWAVTKVVTHHPALRSRFELDRQHRRVCYRTDGEPARVTSTDASAWPATRLRDHVAEECWSGLDLGRDAPVRAQVIAAADRTLLVFVVHHIAADGWSRRLLLDQIALAYRARVAGVEPVLGEPVHPSTVHGEAQAAQTDDLVARLAGAPVDVLLPHDWPRPEIQSTAAATTSVMLDRELTAGLRAVAAGSACTTFVVAAALLGTTLARRGPQRDFVFAFPWNGRDAPGSDAAVGMLVNTLAVRVDLRGVPTWRELLARVRDSCAVSFRNADASFDVVAAALHRNRDLSRPPLTPVYLAANAEPECTPDFGGGVRAEYLPLDPLHIKYELEVTTTDHREQLELAVAYAVDLFDAGTIGDLIEQVVTAARDLGTSPDAHPLAGERAEV